MRNKDSGKKRTRAQKRAQKRRQERSKEQASLKERSKEQTGGKDAGQKAPRRKKKTHRLYAVLVIILGLAIVAGTVILLFYVQRIVVEGNEYCSDEEIAAAVQDDDLSVNSLYVLAKYALGRGEVPPLVDEMEVSLQNPWTLRVSVKEKEAVGYLAYDDLYICFDKEGVALREVTVPPPNLPLVEGIEVEHSGLYESLTSEDTKVFSAILDVSRELKKNELSCDKIVCIRDNIYLYIGNICVSLGDTVSEEQMAQIAPILAELGNREGTLHMENYDGSNGTITFDIDEFPQ